MSKGGILKHKVSKDGLTIQLMWHHFRQKHGITWVKKDRKDGTSVHVPT